jgi:FlaA1/EpsC-like NDP-sugar epimerase
MSPSFWKCARFAGSVLQTFKSKSPLEADTITHPEMAYFMTIPEAVQLVLQAAYWGSVMFMRTWASQ